MPRFRWRTCKNPKSRRVDIVEDLVEGNEENEIYIGLKRPSITDLFQYVDGGLTDTSFFSIRTEFPWQENQPDNGFLVDGVEFCVSWDFVTFIDNANVDLISSIGWADVNCTEQRPVLCSRVCEDKSTEQMLQNDTSSACVGDFELFFVQDTLVTFDEAQEICKSNEGTLPRIEDLSEFSAIESFIEEEGVGNVSFFIGLKRLSLRDPLVFDYVDGNNENKSFFETPKESPWGSNQPSSNQRQTPQCVVWNVQTNKWNDVGCFEPRKALCRRDFCVSETETRRPTTTPTLNKPSTSPSSSPTKP